MTRLSSLFTVRKTSRKITCKVDIKCLFPAPPAFVAELPEVTPFVLTQDSESFLTLSCEVECDPLCDIDWVVSGDMIEVTETSEEDIVDDPVFGFWDEILPSEGQLFTRVRSSLRMSQEDVLNTDEENFTVTCIGGENEYGEAVVSSTTVIIECKTSDKNRACSIYNLFSQTRHRM